MAQTFTPTANIIARASIVIVLLGLVGSIALGMVFYRSPYVTQVGVRREQPIPFSHQRHVGGNGIDCRYCHTSVEDSKFAGIPPTEVCMTCHSQVLADTTLIQPIHESWKNSEPIVWTRVYDLPDFVYFDHSIHVAQGVGCTTCHGEIQEQRLTEKANTLHMAWCLECHRAPQKFLRPRDKVFDVEWRTENTTSEEVAEGLALVEAHNIQVGQLTNCSVCHR